MEQEQKPGFEFLRLVNRRAKCFTGPLLEIMSLSDGLDRAAGLFLQSVLLAMDDADLGQKINCHMNVENP